MVGFFHTNKYKDRNRLVMAIYIDDKDFIKIASIIGYPKVPLIYSKEEILDNCIEPALDEYFKWFPIKKMDTYSIGSGQFNIDFPDDETFGITSAKQINNVLNNTTANAWALYRNLQPGGLRKSIPSSGCKSNGIQDFMYYQYSNASARSIQNQQRAFTIKVDEINRYIYGNSNQDTKMTVEWAKRSDEWEHISFNQRNNAKIVAQGYLAEIIYGIRGQFEVEGQVGINNDIFEKVIDKKDEIIDKWQEMSKVAIIRE